MNIDYPRRRVANTMDLSTIGNKIEIGAYNCCEDFLADLKWIVHNSKAYCGGESQSEIIFSMTFLFESKFR